MWICIIINNNATRQSWEGQLIMTEAQAQQIVQWGSGIMLLSAACVLAYFVAHSAVMTVHAISPWYCCRATVSYFIMEQKKQLFTGKTKDVFYPVVLLHGEKIRTVSLRDARSHWDCRQGDEIEVILPKKDTTQARIYQPAMEMAKCAVLVLLLVLFLTFGIQILPA